MKREEVGEKTKCPKCDGEGCDHCNNTGYHEELSAKQKKIDLNKNGKVDGSDLAKLRSKKEEFKLCEGCDTPKECMSEQSCMGKSEKFTIDGRKKDFKEKLNKLGYKKEENELDEAKLSSSQRDRLDDLILGVHLTTHPEYEGNESPTMYLKMIKKEFGDKVAKQVEDGIEKMHWGRDNRASGIDKLSWRKGGTRINKSGKANKQDINALKNRIKQDKAWGGITKSVKLPEELEFDVQTLIENSDKNDAKEMADLVRELEPKIKDKELQQQVYDLAMEKYKNKTRAKKIASYV